MHLKQSPMGQNVAFVALLSGMLAYWWFTSYWGTPREFWQMSEDGHFLTLGHALNIDFWLFGQSLRIIGNSEITHPGVAYQIISWLAYRLSAPDFFSNPTDLVIAVFDNADWFWPSIQAIPIIMTLGAIWFWWHTSIKYGLIFAVLISLSFLVNSSSFKYPIWLLFNESFAPILAIIFFPLASKCLSPKLKNPTLVTMVTGIAATLIYTQKLTYICWIAALIGGFCVAGLTKTLGWKDVILRTTIFLSTAISLSLTLCWSFFGSAGLKLMVANQWLYFTATEDRSHGSILTLKSLLGGVTKMFQNEPITLSIIVSMILGFLLLACLKHKDSEWMKDHAPRGALLFFAILFTSVGVLKLYHLGDYYIITISVIFPFVLIWLAQSNHNKVLYGLFPLIIIGVFVSGANQYKEVIQDATRGRLIAQERKMILESPLSQGRSRLWMYSLPVPEFNRQLLLQFSSLPELDGIIKAYHGHEYLSSPWHNAINYNNRHTDISEVDWQYHVVHNATVEYIEDKSLHPWIFDKSIQRTRMQHLTVFERP